MVWPIWNYKLSTGESSSQKKYIPPAPDRPSPRPPTDCVSTPSSVPVPTAVSVLPTCSRLRNCVLINVCWKLNYSITIICWRDICPTNPSRSRTSLRQRPHNLALLQGPKTHLIDFNYITRMLYLNSYEPVHQHTHVHQSSLYTLFHPLNVTYYFLPYS